MVSEGLKYGRCENYLQNKAYRPTTPQQVTRGVLLTLFVLLSEQGRIDSYHYCARSSFWHMQLGLV